MTHRVAVCAGMVVMVGMMRRGEEVGVERPRSEKGGRGDAI